MEPKVGKFFIKKSFKEDSRDIPPPDAEKKPPGKKRDAKRDSKSEKSKRVSQADANEAGAEQIENFDEVVDESHTLARELIAEAAAQNVDDDEVMIFDDLEAQALKAAIEQ
jgi:hypothetical protein